MSRYIDADKLQKDGWKLRREKQGLLTSTYETMELDCVPAADVVEVVRCKDCRHNGSFDTDCPIDWNGKEYCSFAEI